MRNGTRALQAALLGAVLAISAIPLSGLWHAFALTGPLARTPALLATTEDPEPEGAAEDGSDVVAQAALADVAAIQAIVNDPPGWTRVARPAMPSGPRRVGIQVGHWKTREAPPELGRILQQTGTSWNGVTEVEVTMEIAERIAALLRPKGIAVDVLPTTIPPGYLADAFVALHADGDGTGENSGYKLAHSTRRTPFEDPLQKVLTDEYGAATGLDYDGGRITNAMRNYYAHAWSRVRYSTSPFTPSVIIELGYLSNDGDRELMIDRADVVAGAIATAIERFLEATSRDDLFGKDLVVPPAPLRRSPSPSPS